MVSEAEFGKLKADIEEMKRRIAHLEKALQYQTRQRQSKQQNQ